MEIIRVVEGSWSFDEDKEDKYILMDVNWFREKYWLVKKYKGRNAFGEPDLVHQQSSWDGVVELVKGLSIKKATVEDRKPKPKPKKIDLIVLFGHGERDDSQYITKRYFPWIWGKWTNGSKFIKDIPTQDLEKDFPEYLI